MLLASPLAFAQQVQDSASALGAAKAASQITSEQLNKLKRELRKDPNNPEVQQAYMQASSAHEKNKQASAQWQQQVNQENKRQRELAQRGPWKLFP